MTDIIIQQNHVGSVIKVGSSVVFQILQLTFQQFKHVLTHSVTLLQQAEVPEDSDDEDPDEVFGLISMLNLTERKVTLQHHEMD